MGMDFLRVFFLLPFFYVQASGLFGVERYGMLVWREGELRYMDDSIGIPSLLLVYFFHLEAFIA